MATWTNSTCFTLALHLITLITSIQSLIYPPRKTQLTMAHASTDVPYPFLPMTVQEITYLISEYRLPNERSPRMQSRIQTTNRWLIREAPRSKHAFQGLQFS
ncbi:hypothetical protein BDW67DRAFT_170409 [Aspergillus spinulosporus]